MSVLQTDDHINYMNRRQLKIVFIAGAYYSEYPEQIKRNIKKAEEYQIALANNRIGFFCPHNHTNGFETKAYAIESFYKELDMWFLQRCDAILMLPGWEESKGATAEHEYANKINMKIFYAQSPDNIEEIIKWYYE